MNTEAQELNRLREDLVARDALIGELRAAGDGMHELGHGLAFTNWARVKKRTPADAGAELERLRTSLKGYLSLCEVVTPPDRENDFFWHVGTITGALAKFKHERDALRAQLATAEAKVAYVEKMGLRFGMMKSSDKPEPYLAHVWDESSDHERMFREWSDSIGWEDKVAAEKQRAEAAEARVRELGGKCDEWTRLYAEQAARLRAVTEALQFYAGKRRADGNGYEFERELIRGEVARNALNPIHAARSADLPPHPDTERLDWLASNGGGFAHDEQRRGISTQAWGEWATGRIAPDEFRAAIDAARAQAGNDAGPAEL